MCTVSWWIEKDKLDLFFNRDEKRERPVAIPPTIHEINGTATIYPIDPEGGGTWITANKEGLILCLLNNYETTNLLDKKQSTSRGQLLLEITAKSVEEACQQLQKKDLSKTNAFFLLVIAPDQEPKLWSWNREKLEEILIDPDFPTFTTSSFLTEKVKSARKSMFLEILDVSDGLSQKLIQKYHHYHNPDRPAHSVFMRRPDASTVSISHIQIDPSKIDFKYFPVDKNTFAIQQAHQSSL